MTSSAWPCAADAVAQLERRVERHAVRVGACQVAWRRLGEGVPLVLLHGGHGSWLHWARNLEALAARHAVWVPDLPGFGDSDVAPGPGLDGLLDATLRSLDALVGPGTPIRLAGFSFGGLVAATLAARRHGVLDLSLLGPAGHGTARRPRGALQAWRELPTGSAAWLDAMRHNLLMHMLHDARSIDPLALQVHGQACLGTRFHSKSISRRGGLQAALAAYAGPVLQIWGAHDVTAHPDRTAALLAEGRNGWRSVVVPDAGHWVQYEAAAQVNALLA